MCVCVVLFWQAACWSTISRRATHEEMAENVPPDAQSPRIQRKIAAGIQHEEMARLQQANLELLAPRVTALTVAESICRELKSSNPFESERVATLQAASSIANSASALLEKCEEAVRVYNAAIEEQISKNAEAEAACEEGFASSKPARELAQRKRKLIDESIATLSGSATAGHRVVGEDLDTMLASTEGCKRLLDRQMATMQELKKEKELATECTNELSSETEPLRAAVKKLKTVSESAASHVEDDMEEGEEGSIDEELREICAWYSSVNQLIESVSGTSVSAPGSFSAAAVRIKILGNSTPTQSKVQENVVTSLPATLVVHFEPGTSRVVAAEVRCTCNFSESTAHVTACHYSLTLEISPL